MFMVMKERNMDMLEEHSRQDRDPAIDIDIKKDVRLCDDRKITGRIF